jgi:hypothetical protein
MPATEDIKYWRMDVFEGLVGVAAVETPRVVKLCGVAALSTLCRGKVMIVAAKQKDLTVAVGSRNQRSMNGDHIAGRNR